MSTYTTVLGDTWDIIAYKTLGKEKYAKELIEENPQYMDTVIFRSGVTLQVPKITTTSVDSTLPPWKQGVTNASS